MRGWTRKPALGEVPVRRRVSSMALRLTASEGPGLRCELIDAGRVIASAEGLSLTPGLVQTLERFLAAPGAHRSCRSARVEDKELHLYQGSPPTAPNY